jgi:predicted  nucleic acid-binding Zn-ribbon protein
VLLQLALFVCVQVARLQREMDGLEEQRTRAREEARKAEHARQQLEQEIKVRARLWHCQQTSHTEYDPP